MARRRHVSVNEKVLIAGLWRMKHMTACRIARITGRCVCTVYNYKNYKSPATRISKTERPAPQAVKTAPARPEIDEALVQIMYNDYIQFRWFDHDQGEVFMFIKYRYWQKYHSRISKWPKYHKWAKVDIIKDLVAMLSEKHRQDVIQKV